MNDRPLPDLARAPGRAMLQLSTAHLSDASVEYLGRPPTQIEGGLAHDDGLFVEPSPDRGGRRHRYVQTGGDNIVAYPHDYGWFVFAHDEFGCDESEVPVDLAEIVLAANKAGFAWINFDAEGPIVENLPIFECEPQDI